MAKVGSAADPLQSNVIYLVLTRATLVNNGGIGELIFTALVFHHAPHPRCSCMSKQNKEDTKDELEN